MQDEQAEQDAEAVDETTDDTTAEAEASADDSGTDVSVEDAPEVPDDQREKITRAQEHINSLNMDEERDALEQTQKKL